MAVKNNFSISEAASYGFNGAKKYWSFLVFCLLISLAVQTIPAIFSSMFDSGSSAFVGFIAQIVGWVLQLVVGLGLIGVTLKIYDKKKPQYKNLFDYFNLIIPYFLGSLIYGFIIMAGLIAAIPAVILFFIPGLEMNIKIAGIAIFSIIGLIWMIYWSIKFRFFPYFMVDKNMDPFKSFAASAKITKGIKLKLVLFGIVMGLINLAGLLLFVVGLLFTVPLSMLAEIYVYRKLASK